MVLDRNRTVSLLIQLVCIIKRAKFKYVCSRTLSSPTTMRPGNQGQAPPPQLSSGGAAAAAATASERGADDASSSGCVSYFILFSNMAFHLWRAALAHCPLTVAQLTRL